MRQKQYQQRPLTNEEQKFFETNMPLVFQFLKTCPRSEREREDYTQELMIGLGIAILTYRPEKGSFSTHAFWRFKQIRSAWLLKKKRKVNKLMTDIEGDHEEFKIEPEYNHEKTKLEEFREFISTELTAKERESVEELAWQRVSCRLLTQSQIHARNKLRLRVIDRIRETFCPGEVNHGKKRQRTGKRPAPNHGRGLRDRTQFILFGSDSHDHSGRAIS